MDPKPCPFCGSTAASVQAMHHGTATGINEDRQAAVFVRCHACAAEGPWTRAADLESGTAAAIRRWNQRDTPNTVRHALRYRWRSVYRSMDEVRYVQRVLRGMLGRDRPLVERVTSP